MGLDITAYRQIKEVRGCPRDDESYYDEGLTRFWNNTDFPDRFDGLKEETAYSYVDNFAFRAGSYSGYNRWREWLAGLVGTTPDRVWNGEQPSAFGEIINFADNEGTLGPAVCAKLAKDFASHDAQAKQANPDGYDYYDRYSNWRKAFEMAADGGAVSFH